MTILSTLAHVANSAPYITVKELRRKYGHLAFDRLGVWVEAYTYDHVVRSMTRRRTNNPFTAGKSKAVSLRCCPHRATLYGMPTSVSGKLCGHYVTIYAGPKWKRGNDIGEIADILICVDSDMGARYLFIEVKAYSEEVFFEKATVLDSPKYDSRLGRQLTRYDSIVDTTRNCFYIFKGGVLRTAGSLMSRFNDLQQRQRLQRLQRRW